MFFLLATIIIVMSCSLAVSSSSMHPMQPFRDTSNGHCLVSHYLWHVYCILMVNQREMYNKPKRYSLCIDSCMPGISGVHKRCEATHVLLGLCTTGDVDSPNCLGYTGLIKHNTCDFIMWTVLCMVCSCAWKEQILYCCFAQSKDCYIVGSH